ncbi:MAG: protein translocase subunit SecF [bacterium]
MHLFLSTHYPFMKWRKIGYAFSLITLAIALLGLIVKGGPKWSVDFTGGTLVQIGVGAPTNVGALRSALEPIGFAGAEIQQFGGTNDYLIRVDRSKFGDQTAIKVVEALRAGMAGTNVEVRRTEDVGPKVGSELKWGAAKALALGLLAVLIYVGVRYEFRFAATGVLALFHDMVFVVGILTILNREFSLNVVAALLTIAGYSINDTIIVFDRIRENMRTMRRENFSDVIDESINNTLSRTVITSGLTMMTVVALLIFGGEVIRDFAIALMIGIAVGTYSSIFVAGAVVLDWRTRALASAERKKTKPRPVAA